MSRTLTDIKLSAEGFFRKTKFPKWVLIIIGALIILRLFLPSAILYGMNWALKNKMGAYTGQLEDFDLSLYRGAYQAQGLTIEKKSGNLPALLKIKEIDLSLAWRRIFRGELEGDITVDRLVINLLDSDNKEKRQNGTEEKNWNEVFQVLIPIHIETLKIKNSTINFSNPDLTKDQVVQLEQINLTAEQLRSRAKGSLSPVKATALLQNHAPLKLNGKIDAMANPPRADLDFSVVEFKPKTVNKLLISYLPLDLTEGQISLYGEAATVKKDLTGYVNVFLKNIDVVSKQQEIVNGKHFLIETATSFANWFLKNDKTEEVAAHIPFKRDNGKFELNAKEAIWSAINNKDDNLKKGVQNSVSLKDLEGETKNN